MGRPTWATKEQEVFLEAQTNGLEIAKRTSGLQAEYSRIAKEFLMRWPVVPGLPDAEADSGPTDDDEGSADVETESRDVGRKPKKPSTPEELLAWAEQKKRDQIHDWYKNRRKSAAQPQQKKPLDLTGKSTRKPVPHQLHQAYSVIHYRPKGSALRVEVADLWNRREEQEVIDLVSRFSKSKDTGSDSFLKFQNAIMRWKCSLLTKEEVEELEVWIAKSVKVKKGVVTKPWTEGGANDELSTENEFIQKSIDSLTSTIDMALKEVERKTGMKAIMLIGGPTPKAAGNITTHAYETGVSRETDLRFSQSWEGFEPFHEAFVQWLRSVYSKEDIARRGGPPPTFQTATPGPSTPSQTTTPGPSTPSQTTTPDPSTPLESVKEIGAAPETSLLPSEVSSPTLDQAHGITPDHPGSQPQQSPPPASTTQDRPGTSSPPSPVGMIASVTDDASRPTNTTDQPTGTEATDQPTDTADQPTDDADQFAQESGSLPAGRGDSGRIPPPVGTLKFEGTSAFLTPDVIDYLQTIPAGRRWAEMVSSYLRMEEFPIAKGSSMRLSTTSRPEEVSNWIRARSFKLDHIPFVPDVRLYHDKWIQWWTSCQPSWRRDRGWPLPTDNSDVAKWAIKAGARGKNGLFLVVLSTAWWASSIRSDECWAKFDEAVEDVHWMINQVSNALEALPANAPPVPPTRSNTSQEPSPTPGAAWMVRADGKRRPKPSRRLLEAEG